MLGIDRVRVGKEDDYWHPECIKLALQKEYGHGNFVFRKQDFAEAINRGAGSLLVRRVQVDNSDAYRHSTHTKCSKFR